MKLRLVLALLLASSAGAFSAPPPPPPAEETEMLGKFFGRFKELPPEHLSSLEPLVAEDLKVYQEGRLAYDDRAAWFAFLRSLGGQGPSGPRGLSVSREKFFKVGDGVISVLEFQFPMPPKGMEGQIAYHPVAPFQMVTYHFKAGRLVRLDYGPRMQTYDHLESAP